LDWVHQLSADLERGTILLAGRLDDPDPALLRLPRVAHLPPLPLAQLPALGQAADLLIMPYADLPVTRAMQPLKLLEYLATAKPVIVRDLPAVAPWRDALDACHDGESFAAAVLRRLEHGITAEQSAARERLSEESWAAK